MNWFLYWVLSACFGQSECYWSRVYQLFLHWWIWQVIYSREYWRSLSLLGKGSIRVPIWKWHKICVTSHDTTLNSCRIWSYQHEISVVSFHQPNYKPVLHYVLSTWCLSVLATPSLPHLAIDQYCKSLVSETKLPLRRLIWRQMSICSDIILYYT